MGKSLLAATFCFSQALGRRRCVWRSGGRSRPRISRLPPGSGGAVGATGAGPASTLCRPPQVFPREAVNYTAENIHKWALENREALLRWLRPHGGKSLLLNNELKKGPALLVFLPFNPLAESHPLIDEVRVVMFKDTL